ncbi:Reverse transcriptase (RNA-dependent DNA polymerase) [Popillia japonica]|uniref:RNA-directed DNA polymerase n=1 Tax=Popillia japonica TaxID=7064 RepID=A0AAW1JD57_POPJA
MNYIDDIIVYGKTEEEHDKYLHDVLEVLKSHNVLLNEKKSQFKVRQLAFLGHILTSSGKLPDPKKTKVFQDCQAPTNKEELRSFLGLVTYLGKFIPNLGMLTYLFRTLIRRESKMEWGNREQKVFEQLKMELGKLPKLAYFDLKRRTQLIADASPIALGAVLLQYDETNTRRVISFAKAIFKPTSKPPARIERWLLRLQAFKFTIKYRPGKSNIADPLSRLYKLEADETFDEPNVRTIIQETIPKALAITKVISESKRDTEIAAASNKLSHDSWFNTDSSPLYPFRFELTSIPTTLRNQILQLAHEGHPGETPSRPSPMVRQKLPQGPWQYLSLHYMSGEPNQDYLLVIIDYYTRYAETIFTKTTSTTTVIRALEDVFCRLGLPKTIKTDNFTSEEFKSCCGIDLVNSPPYCPQANGEVENLNKSLKKRLQIAYQKGDKDYKKEIITYLMMYNVTPHGTTGKSPSELLINRRIRDKIPCIEDIYMETLDEEVKATNTEIKPGNKVLVKKVVCSHKLTSNFDNEEYEVISKHGNEVTVFGRGKIIKRNVAHLKKLPESSSPSQSLSSSPSQSISRNSSVSHPPLEMDQVEDSQNSTPKLQPLKLVKKGGMWRPIDKAEQKECE